MKLVPLDEIFQSYDYFASYGDVEGGDGWGGVHDDQSRPQTYEGCIW